MVRQVIQIDEEKCNGCGICANACHEGAIDIVDGKAKLVRENFCDGFGDCLPGCPTGAITFITKEAPAYDEAAVKEAQQRAARQEEAQQGVSRQPKVVQQEEAQQRTAQQSKVAQKPTTGAPAGGCPGSRIMQINRSGDTDRHDEATAAGCSKAVSRLQNWPVQIKLAPIQAPYFEGAKLLIAADCTAYAYASFHEDFIKGKVTIVGCPKLDSIDYSEKLMQIIAGNDIKSVTIVRMEVPCCGGLEMAAKKALQASGKFIPWQVVTIGINGEILD